MKNACRRKSVLLLTCCIWLKLGIWIRFLPVWWKKCLINIFQDLALASDQFFRYLSQFFYFLWFARVTGKRYKERSSWRTKYSSIILRAERMEKAREVNKGDLGRRLIFDVRRIGLFVLLALLHHSSFLSSHLGSTLLFPCFLARKLTSFAICRMFLLSWYSEVCKMKSLGTFGVKYISRLGCIWRVAYNISFQKLGTTDITLLQKNKC